MNTEVAETRWHGGDFRIGFATSNRFSCRLSSVAVLEFVIRVADIGLGGRREAVLGPELTASFEAVLVLGTLRLHGPASDRNASFLVPVVVHVFLVLAEVSAFPCKGLCRLFASDLTRLGCPDCLKEGLRAGLFEFGLPLGEPLLLGFRILLVDEEILGKHTA